MIRISLFTDLELVYINEQERLKKISEETMRTWMKAVKEHDDNEEELKQAMNDAKASLRDYEAQHPELEHLLKIHEYQRQLDESEVLVEVWERLIVKAPESASDLIARLMKAIYGVQASVLETTHEEVARVRKAEATDAFAQFTTLTKAGFAPHYAIQIIVATTKATDVTSQTIQVITALSALRR